MFSLFFLSLSLSLSTCTITCYFFSLSLLVTCYFYFLSTCTITCYFFSLSPLVHVHICLILSKLGWHCSSYGLLKFRVLGGIPAESGAVGGGDTQPSGVINPTSPWSMVVKYFRRERERKHVTLHFFSLSLSLLKYVIICNVTCFLSLSPKIFKHL